MSVSEISALDRGIFFTAVYSKGKQHVSEILMTANIITTNVKVFFSGSKTQDEDT
jgi:hypothetical protein